MAEITPLEAAKRIEEHNRIHSHKEPHAFFIRQALDIAASYLRAIAAGEYKRVVHGRWKRVSDDFLDVGDAFFCSECDEPQERMSKFCPSCGALMDESRDGNSHNGKDDSHETD